MKVLEGKIYFVCAKDEQLLGRPSLSLVTVLTLEYFEPSGIYCGGSVIVVVYHHCRHYGLVIFGVIPFTLCYN